MTPKVTLRDVTDDDVEVFYRQQLDADASAMAAFASRDRDAHFAHWSKIRKGETNIMKTVELDGRVAGNLVSWIDNGKREVGYWIGKEFWGRGIATAALQRLIELVEDRPLYAWVARHNSGSIRVLEKCGFVHTGEHEIHLIYELR